MSQVFPEGFVGQIFNTVIPKDRQVGYFGLGGYTVGGDLSGLGVWGAVNLMEGYGGDNPSAKSQGMKQLMAGGGVALIGITLIPLLSGLFG